MVKQIKILAIILFLFNVLFAQIGKLNVGFDIDDTVLYSERIFVAAPTTPDGKIDYSWVNMRDKDFSLIIEPIETLIHFFRAHGHAVYFITARPSINGEYVADFLTKKLNFDIEVNKNLFFSPKETVDQFRYTTKHRLMTDLDIDIFYGDSDTDMIAAIKAGVHAVRIVRSDSSILEYGSNYFGNTLRASGPEAPFTRQDIDTFYDAGVGVFGESIYPIVWNPPAHN